MMKSEETIHHCSKRIGNSGMGIITMLKNDWEEDLHAVPNLWVRKQSPGAMKKDKKMRYRDH